MKVTVHPEHFERIATVQKGSLAAGWIKVEATKDGYASGTEVLAEIDCGSSRRKIYSTTARIPIE